MKTLGKLEKEVFCILSEEHFRIMNSIEDVKNTIFITFPVRDIAGNYITVFVTKEGGCYKISDDCYTLAEFNKKKIIKTKKVLPFFGVGITEHGELFNYADKYDFFMKLNAFVLCVLAIERIFQR